MRGSLELAVILNDINCECIFFKKLGSGKSKEHVIRPILASDNALLVLHQRSLQGQTLLLGSFSIYFMFLNFRNE